jgi:hypothetical protein
MNAIDKFSGAESAARILGARRWETMECGHGHCAASEPCTGPCRLKDAVLNLPVIDPAYLDEQLYRKDAGGFGGLDHLPVEMIEPIRSVKVWAEHLKTAALVVAALAALACTFYVTQL